MSFDDLLLALIALGFFLGLGYVRAELRAHQDRIAEERKRLAQYQSLSSGSGMAH